MAGVPVTLHLYDVTGKEVVTGVNKLLKPLGTGAFHAGVEVNGEEWSFGYCEEGSGVFKDAPKSCEEHKYRESIAMGSTTLSDREIGAVIDRLHQEWPGSSYDLLRRNCCSFADELCYQLGVGHIPKWVTNLAGAGATVQDGFQKVQQEAQRAQIIAVAKAEEIDAKYQIKSTTTAKAKDFVAKVAELDEKHRFSEKGQQICDKTEEALKGFAAKTQEWDDKHKVSETIDTHTKAAVAKATPVVKSAAAAVGAFLSGLSRPSSASGPGNTPQQRT